MPFVGMALASSGRWVSRRSASLPLMSCVCTACHRSRRYDVPLPCSGSSGTAEVPGGRFSGLERCGTSAGGGAGSAGSPAAGRSAGSPNGGTAGSPAAARVEMDCSPGNGSGGGGAGASGSACAMGAASINAANSPSAPPLSGSGHTFSDFLTDAPSLVDGAIGCFSLGTPIVTPVQGGTKDAFATSGPEHVSLTSFCVVFYNPFTRSDLWCSNAIGALDDVV